MTDPFEVLREPVVPVDPDPDFAARLRLRMTQAVFAPPGVTMSEQTISRASEPVEREAPWPPALSPYIVVSDARRALAWYTEVFGARQRGELHVNADGTIGHAEIGIGDSVLMFAETSELYPDVPVSAPDSPTTHSHTLHLQLPDVDAAVALARRRGATVEREPGTEPYGRAAVIVDPFDHRWLLLTPPPRATRLRQGDLARVTMVTPDALRAKDFYEAVLQVPFAPGRVPGAWSAPDVTPPIGMWSPPGEAPQVQPCFRVDDVAAAVARVRAAGGAAEDAERMPYGLLAECTDDQGLRFQLWQPA
ncbi:MAG TPA: VOC family protein [Actinophytocola sp.]|nr:VOC family protein [Actinophytocola sp.]